MRVCVPTNIIASHEYESEWSTNVLPRVCWRRTFSFVSLSKVEDSIKYSEFSAITSTIENWIGSRILRHFGNGISSDYYDEYVVLVLLSL